MTLWRWVHGPGNYSYWHEGREPTPRDREAWPNTEWESVKHLPASRLDEAMTEAEEFYRAQYAGGYQAAVRDREAAEEQLAQERAALKTMRRNHADRVGDWTKATERAKAAESREQQLRARVWKWIEWAKGEPGHGGPYFDAACDLQQALHPRGEGEE